ncbi:MAG: hypothetical protein HY726_09610 [Candidatus Rokubacteria bacterium]|nr:hypothetical protein [Candidatus Rokubacteria bacterium]
MAGEVAATLLSRMAVPVLYYLSETTRQTRPVTAQAEALAPGSESRPGAGD